jgi:hypothetical protein
MTTTTSKANHYDQAIRRLADAFSSEFAEFCSGHERMHELMMELASEYVETNIPIVAEDDQTDVASELLMSVTVTKV